LPIKAKQVYRVVRMHALLPSAGPYRSAGMTARSPHRRAISCEHSDRFEFRRSFGEPLRVTSAPANHHMNRIRCGSLVSRRMTARGDIDEWHEMLSSRDFLSARLTPTERLE
jgi:hypothetical protein